MVTRIYTPPLTPYYRAGVSMADQTPGRGQTEPESTSLPPQEHGGDGFQAERRSQGLASVLETQHAQHGIRIGTIIQDFQSTLGALGADSQTQSEVNAYLDVVKIQAGKPQPEIGFIKHSLKTAAGTMDRFISQALGQPSTVVKDWVDALLLQKIDYHLENLPQPTSEADTEQANPTIKETVAGANFGAINSGSNSEDLKSWLKAQIQQSKALAEDGQILQAKTLLLSTLREIEEQSLPGATGRINALLGRYSTQMGQPSEALVYYTQAQAAYAQSGQPLRQAQVLDAMAGLYERQGQWEQAKGHYERAVSLLTQHPDRTQWPHLHLSQTLNDLGTIYLQQNQPAKAVETLLQAYQQGSHPEAAGSHQQELPEILSNLGAAYRALNQTQKAEDAYRLSLKQARQRQDREAYYSTLLNLLDLYESTGQSALADKARQRLAQLNPNPQAA